MAGILDFINTPEGQGLLAGAFGAAAGARRGAPWNTFGRGGLSALAGYSGALDRQAQEAERAALNQDRSQMRDVRALQLEEARRTAEKAKAEQAWLQGLPQAIQQTQDQHSTTEPTVIPGNPNAVRDYLMRPDSPFLPKLLEQQFLPKAADYKVVGGSLVRVGPNGVTPVYEGPKKDGQPTKVQEYEYAKANGYKGTFDQYVTLGPRITADAMAPLRLMQLETGQRQADYTLPPVTPTPAPAPRSASSRSGGPVTVTVQGQTFTFPSQEAANQFKMRAGVR